MLNILRLLFVTTGACLLACGPSGQESELAISGPDTVSVDPLTTGAGFESIILRGITCGDNCYLAYTLPGSPDSLRTALCRVPECGDWEASGILPDSLRQRPARARFATGEQADGAGTVMQAEYPSIVELQFGPASNGEVEDNRLALEPGLYVIDGSDCADPANAGLRVWTGSGLEGSATSGCTFEVTSRDGMEYIGRQSCTNTADGSQTTTDLSIEILEPGSIVLTEADETTHLTLCPEGEVSEWVKGKLIED